MPRVYEASWRTSRALSTFSVRYRLDAARGVAVICVGSAHDEAASGEGECHCAGEVRAAERRASESTGDALHRVVKRHEFCERGESRLELLAHGAD